jgi:hypothetical protein
MAYVYQLLLLFQYSAVQKKVRHFFTCAKQLNAFRHQQVLLPYPQNAGFIVKRGFSFQQRP